MCQSYTGSMECLLVDDCGTDNSISIAKRMIDEYEGPIQFCILHHDRNKGLSAARNTGIKHATGNYLYFLDSDDKITPDCVEKLMAVTREHPDAEMVQGNVRTWPVKVIDGMLPTIKRQAASTNDEVRGCFYKDGQLIIAAWNKLMKRAFVMEHGLLFMEGVVFEDTPWLFHMVKHLQQVFFVSDVTYYYLRRGHSIMTGASEVERAKSFYKIYHHILENLTASYERQELDFWGRKFAYFYARHARQEKGFFSEMPRWQEKAKQYATYRLRLRLAASRLLARTSHGWLALSLVNRLEHPKNMIGDIQSFWLRKTRMGK